LPLSELELEVVHVLVFKERELSFCSTSEDRLLFFLLADGIDAVDRAGLLGPLEVLLFFGGAKSAWACG
jgi:hypothetical protein